MFKRTQKNYTKYNKIQIYNFFLRKFKNLKLTLGLGGCGTPQGSKVLLSVMLVSNKSNMWLCDLDFSWETLKISTEVSNSQQETKIKVKNTINKRITNKKIYNTQ